VSSIASGPAVGPTEPPALWVHDALSSGIKWLEHEAVFHVSSRLRVCGDTPPLLIRHHGVVLNLVFVF
jgi:hypothetical protein